MNKTICLAWTGASGLPYGVRLLECLLSAGCHVQLLYSQAAQIVAKQEMDLVLPTQPREAQRLFAEMFGAQEGQLARDARAFDGLVEVAQQSMHGGSQSWGYGAAAGAVRP